MHGRAYRYYLNCPLCSAHVMAQWLHHAKHPQATASAVSGYTWPGMQWWLVCACPHHVAVEGEQNDKLGGSSLHMQYVHGQQAG